MSMRPPQQQPDHPVTADAKAWASRGAAPAPSPAEAPTGVLTVTLRLPLDLVEDIDAAAKAQRLSRSAWMRTMLQSCATQIKKQ